MFLWLAQLSNWISALNVFQYTTFRAVMAALTALMFSLLLGPWTIRQLTKLKMRQPIRTDGPKTHFIKKCANYGWLIDFNHDCDFHSAVGQLGKRLYLDFVGGNVGNGRAGFLR